MATRVHIGRRPDNAETGFWVSKPGFDAVNDDRTDPAKFRFSSSFVGRRPLRIIAAGISRTNTPIACPDTLGGEPLIMYRVMTGGASERPNGYVGSQNDGSGGSFSHSEFFNRLIYNPDGSRYFLIQITRAESNTDISLRYVIAVF